MVLNTDTPFSSDISNEWSTQHDEVDGRVVGPNIQFISILNSCLEELVRRQFLRNNNGGYRPQIFQFNGTIAKYLTSKMH